MLVAAAAGAAEGDWLIAGRQLAGRGRIGRQWQSPEGNLYTSGLIRLCAGDPSAATLAMVAAVAVHDAVARWTGASAIELKWPNDLMANGAKLAGILLERVGDAVVLGVGVNLVQMPSGLERPVTSVAALGISPPAPIAFAEELSVCVSGWLKRWRSDGLDCIRTAWLARAHPVGTAIAATLADGEYIRGVFNGLSDDCALQMRLADDTVREIHAADVFLI